MAHGATWLASVCCCWTIKEKWGDDVKTLIEQLRVLRADMDAEAERLFAPAEPVNWEYAGAEGYESLPDHLESIAEYIGNYEYKPVDYSEYYRLWHREIYGE